MAVPLKSASLDQPFYRNEHLFVDLRQPLVILDGQTLTLTRQEYSLLALLVQHAGEIVPRATLLTQIFGYVSQARTRTVDAHIGRLRKKLGREGRRIETIFGKGYRFRLQHQGPPEADAPNST
jgi:DNA-binding response OmpR family regulator